MYVLFDYLEQSGQNTMKRWVDRERLSSRDRAALNQKLDRLRQLDFVLATGTKLLAPVHPHVYKLRVFGDSMMRPMLCRGPIEVKLEYTLLLGAMERDRKLHPKEWKQIAIDNRTAIEQDERRRGPHERL